MGSRPRRGRAGRFALDRLSVAARPAFVAGAVIAGAALLLWPAFWNGYPILFSDTHAFLIQGDEPRMIWDKPWIYGPFLRLLHGGLTLWLPAAAQALLLSHLLWLTEAVLGARTPLRHVGLCAFLAAGSAAPWFVSLLMPDIFAAMTMLCIFLLAFDEDLRGWLRGWVAALGIFSVAAHLSHLVIAAACACVVGLLRRRAAPIAAVPLLGALALLLLTNIVGYGLVAISPYGSVFLLARLVADGPARAVIARDCPAAGWHLCAWAGRLPRDSDDFLWSGDGPVWSTPGGPPALAPEAGTIVARTIMADPLGVARAAVGNTLHELVRVRLGDTLGPDWLEQSVVRSLHDYLPPSELVAFRASLQAQGRLAPVGKMLNRVQGGLLIAGALACLILLRRPERPVGRLAALALAAVLANAFATGALSDLHDRYQARIAWVLLLPPAFLVIRKKAGSAE
jgi:hypothetical protein